MPEALEQYLVNDHREQMIGFTVVNRHVVAKYFDSKSSFRCLSSHPRMKINFLSWSFYEFQTFRAIFSPFSFLFCDALTEITLFLFFFSFLRSYDKFAYFLQSMEEIRIFLRSCEKIVFSAILWRNLGFIMILWQKLGIFFNSLTKFEGFFFSEIATGLLGFRSHWI